jgi:hypothetical protein
MSESSGAPQDSAKKEKLPEAERFTAGRESQSSDAAPVQSALIFPRYAK